MKNFVVILVGLLVVAGAYYWYTTSRAPVIEPPVQAMGDSTDHRNGTYMIEGEAVQLIHGMAETPAAIGSAAKVVTRYFGNELLADLDGDGTTDDVVFLLTQSRGGTGTFYYAVAAVQTDTGFIGSDGYPLGDRIAPQGTNVSPNPRHKNVVVINYADRKAGDPMTASPSRGKSVYLKLDTASMRWGIVEPDFEGESR